MTINIIKKWENIGENYLDSNLEYTEDASQKIGLEQAFQRSIELMPNEIEDPISILQAIYEISRRVKLSNKDYITAAYNKLMTEITTKLLDKYSYRELIEYMDASQKSDQEINAQISQNQQVIDLTKKAEEDEDVMASFQAEMELDGLTDRLRSELIRERDDRDSFNQKLLNKIFKEIFNPREIKNNRGIIYKIENKQGCASYLIGSMHISSKFLEGTKISKIVQESSEFFSEIGDYVFDPSQSKRSGVMDAALTKMASDKSIPIHALETPKDIHELDTYLNAQKISPQARADRKEKRESKLKKLGLIKTLNEYRSAPKLFVIDVLEAWMKGDPETIKNFFKANFALTSSEYGKRELKLRNKNWLINKNLLTKVESTEKPLSIVVGIAHLFGKTGLLKAFEDQGLKLQQI